MQLPLSQIAFDTPRLSGIQAEALNLTIALLEHVETTMIDQSAEVQEVLSQMKRQLLLVGDLTEGTTSEPRTVICGLRATEQPKSTTRRLKKGAL